MKQSPIRYAALSALLIFSLAARAAALLTISVETDRDTVEINDNLFLTVTVAGDSASVPEPTLPNMQNFNIYSSGRSQNISIINGKITTTVSFTYILTPRFIGVQTIPAISVFNGREKAISRELQVSVKKPSQQPQAGQQPPKPRPHRPGQAQLGAAQEPQLSLKAETDRRTAYPGEQINLSVKFYTSVPLSSNPQYVQPVFKNLISEDLPPVRTGETEINGTRFAYSEIKTALFALTPGPAEIKPATVIAQIPSEQAVDLSDPNFFQNFMAMSGSQGKSREFSTEDLRLEIKPLPPGAPQNFSGAVGNYAVSASADRGDAKTGEPVNFSVTVAGSGNLKAVTAPPLPEMPDFKVFDTMSSLDVKKEGDLIGGKKTFTYILVPRTEGRHTIPPIKFSFFDPRAGTYSEQQTAPVTLVVQKGEQSGNNVYYNQPGSEGPVAASGTDIRYVSDRTGPDTLTYLAARVSALPLWVHSVPALLLALSFWLARLNRFKSANPLLFRFRRARVEADKDIARADALMKAGSNNEAVSVLYDSFIKYLSDKCGVNVGALTMKKAAELIKERFPGTSDPALAEVRELWAALELRHFSPEAALAEGTADLSHKYSLLLELLEKELKP